MRYEIFLSLSLATSLSLLVITTFLPVFAADNPYLQCPDCNDTNSIAPQKSHPITAVTEPVIVGNGTSFQFVIIFNSTPAMDQALASYNEAVNFEKAKSIILSSNDPNSKLLQVLSDMDTQFAIAEKNLQGIKEYTPDGTLTQDYTVGWMLAHITGTAPSDLRAVTDYVNRGMSLQAAFNQYDNHFNQIIANFDLNPTSAPTPPVSQPVVIVTTDQSSYSIGDPITISGSVGSVVVGNEMTIQILDTTNNIVFLDAVIVTNNGKYVETLKAGGTLWKTGGTYTVKVIYGDPKITAQTSFTFMPPTGTAVKNEPPIENPTLDQTYSLHSEGLLYNILYSINGGAIQSMMTSTPEPFMLQIGIFAKSDGSITIDLPRKLIDSKSSYDDKPFDITINGNDYQYTETKNQTTRTVNITFHQGLNSINIIGTQISGNYAPGSLPPPPRNVSSGLSEDGSTQVTVKTSSPQSGQPLSLSLTFANVDGRLIQHQNYVILISQQGKVVLSNRTGYADSGSDTQITIPLSSNFPVDIMVDLNGVGQPSAYPHWSGPSGVDLFFHNMGGTNLPIVPPPPPNPNPENYDHEKSLDELLKQRMVDAQRLQTLLQGQSSSGLSNIVINQGAADLGATTVGSDKIPNCAAAKNCFSPNPKYVSPGTTVTWTNNDKLSHNITSGKDSDNNTGSLFFSGALRPGSSFQFTFATAGTYDYFCTVHPWMTGQVIVGGNHTHENEDHQRQNEQEHPRYGIMNYTQQDVNNIEQAKSNQTIAAEVNVGANNTQTTTSIDNNISVQTTQNTPDSLGVQVSANNQTGPKVIVFNLAATTINVQNLKDLGVMYDGKPIQPAINMDAILHAKPTDSPSFAIVVTQSGIQVLVLVPHFSTHTITITNMSKVIPVVPEFGSIAGVIITISVIISLVISRRFSNLKIISKD